MIMYCLSLKLEVKDDYLLNDFEKQAVKRMANNNGRFHSTVEVARKLDAPGVEVVPLLDFLVKSRLYSIGMMGRLLTRAASKQVLKYRNA